MSQVAKLPTTLPELMERLRTNALSSDDLINLTLEQLDALHIITKAGTTKPIRLFRDQLEGQIKAKRKDAARAGKQAEPVANSVKAPEKPEETSQAPADKAPAKAKAPTKPKTQAKPKTGPAKAPAPAKKASAGKTETETPKPARKSRQAAPKEAEPEASEAGEEEGLPPVFDAEGYRYTLAQVKGAEELGKLLLDHHYGVFAWMDENYEDGNMTMFLVAYASADTVLFVDKSRKLETFMYVEGYMIEKGAYIMTEGKKEYRFPIVFYTRERIA